MVYCSRSTDIHMDHFVGDNADNLFRRSTRFKSMSWVFRPTLMGAAVSIPQTHHPPLLPPR